MSELTPEDIIKGLRRTTDEPETDPFDELRQVISQEVTARVLRFMLSWEPKVTVKNFPKNSTDMIKLTKAVDNLTAAVTKLTERLDKNKPSV